jgi:hypothetical protein
MLNLLATDVVRHGGRPVRFNAWHHREQDRLLAAMFENIRLQAIPPIFTWPGFLLPVRLFLVRTRRLWQLVLAASLFVAVAALTVRLGTQGLKSEAILNQLGVPVPSEIFGKATPFLDERVSRWLSGFRGIGVVAVAVGLWVRAKTAESKAIPMSLAGFSKARRTRAAARSIGKTG